MLGVRVLPPVYSPVTPAAIASGLAALLAPTPARTAVTGALTDRFKPEGVLLTDSGTSALALALRAAAPLAPGPVALPAYSCYDVATAADAAGVEVLLYDLDPHTLGPDLVALQHALERGARRVVVSHLYGVPIDIGAVRTLLNRCDALLIEDAAQGAGASYGGRPLGSFGSLSVLSFGRGKGITSGRGGAVLANDVPSAAALAAVAGPLRPGGTSALDPIRLVAQWLLARPALYGIPASVPFLGLGETVYRRPEESRGMSPFALGVLRNTLPSAEHEAESRRAHARRLLTKVSAAGKDITQVQTLGSAVPGYLRLPVLLSGASRAGSRSDPAKRLGIMPGYPGTLGDLAGFGTRVRNAGVGFPGASHLVASLVTLPTHSLLGEGDLRALEHWIELPPRMGRHVDLLRHR